MCIYNFETERDREIFGHLSFKSFEIVKRSYGRTKLKRAKRLTFRWVPRLILFN